MRLDRVMTENADRIDLGCILLVESIDNVTKQWVSERLKGEGTYIFVVILISKKVNVNAFVGGAGKKEHFGKSITTLT